VSEHERAPTIGVIVPHLNQHEELRRCLASLIDQSFDPECVEIIVVDNGSTALPAGTCRSHPRVCLAEEAKPGPGPARNTGVRISRAEILAFIDADCIADRNWLLEIEAAFSDRRVHIVGGDVRIAPKDPGRPTMVEAYESIFAYRQKEYIERQHFSGAGNLAMRRSAYQAVGPFAGIEVAEDRDWGQRAARLGYAIRYIPTMIVSHPARAALSDLYVKWDRHISHDFAANGERSPSHLVWAVRALAVACSPVLEIGRLLTSRRVSSWRERWLAAMALVNIRAYRSRRMLKLLVGRAEPAASRSWNRT
jgi:glycosyltransferase involved in cell wall biosynthesis